MTCPVCGEISHPIGCSERYVAPVFHARCPIESCTRTNPCFKCDPDHNNPAEGGNDLSGNGNGGRL
jgi:hypothetical protein